MIIKPFYVSIAYVSTLQPQVIRVAGITVEASNIYHAIKLAQDILIKGDDKRDSCASHIFDAIAREVEGGTWKA